MSLSFGSGTRRIKGYIAGGEIVMAEPAAPGAPTITAAQSAGNPQTHLTIGLTGGMPARGDYIRLQYKLQSSSTWLDGPGSMVAGDFPYELSVLIQEKDWDVRAYARNDYGESAASSTVQASTASPPSGNVVAAVTATGYDQTVTNGGIITGPAPLAVHFDCTGSQSASLGANETVFTHLRAHADFGNAFTGTWTNVASSKDEHVGALIFGRVFEAPGTYNVGIRVGDGTDSDTVTVQVVVVDPETYFSNEVDIAVGGSWPSPWVNDTLYRLAAGDHSGKGALTIPCAGKDKIQVRGDASSLRTVTGTSGLTSDPGSASFTRTKRIQFVGIAFSGVFNVGTVGDCVTVSRCTARSVRVGDLLASTYTTYGGSSITRPNLFALHETSVQATSADSYALYAPYGASRMIVSGGSYLLGTGTQHTCRTQGQYKCVYDHVFFGRPADATKHFLTIRAHGTQVWTSDYGSSQTALASQNVVSSCVFGIAGEARVTWHLHFGPLTDTSIARIEYALAEKCVFAITATGSDRNIVFGGDLLMERDNTTTKATNHLTNTRYTNMTAADFQPVWGDSFAQGFTADVRIQNPTTFDPGAP